MKRNKIYILSILLLLCLLVFTASVNKTIASSKTSIDLKPKLDTLIGKYGYVDSKGKWVIKPQFEEAKDFSDGLAVVTYFNTSDDFYAARTGYINSKGQAAFGSRFYRANDFKDGYAPVTDKDEKLSMIDKKGKVVLKTNYYLNTSYTSEVAGIHTIITDCAPSKYLENAKFGYITNSLKLVKPMFDGPPYYHVDKETKEKAPCANYSEKDSNNKVIKLHQYLLNKKMEPKELPIKLSNEFISGISDGMILMQLQNSFAYANMEGKIIDKIYDSVTKKYYKLDIAYNFSEGHAVVGVEYHLKDIVGDPDQLTGFGYLNKDGTTFKNPQYQYAQTFKQGLAAVQPHPSWVYGMGIIKSNGDYFKDPVLRVANIKIDKNYSEFINASLHTQEEYDYVKSEVKRITSEIINSKMSDLEKVTAINKYVIDHTVYPIAEDHPRFYKDDKPLYVDYEAIGILKHGKAKCSGYTNLTGLLLKEAGIENKYVGGYVKTLTRVQGHAWNLVKLDGKYYHLDTTWNDDDTNTNKYFLVSDDYMKKNAYPRTWSTSTYPAAPKGYFNDKPQKK